MKADPLHADFLGLLRDPLVHRTLKRRVTFGAPLGQVFPDTPSDDRTMLMLAGDFEGRASDIHVGRPGGEPVPMQQIHAPDEFLMHDQCGTGPDSVRTVSARELVDSAITARPLVDLGTGSTGCTCISPRPSWPHARRR